MEINNRIRLLRKGHLNITQEEFASKIKISRSNLGSIEIGRISVTDRVIEDICVQFNVSEDWLRYGQGEMFIQASEFSLNEYAEKSNLSELELDLIKGYMDLSVDARKEILSTARSIFNKHSEVAATIDNSIDEELESYRLELEAEKKGQISSVLGEFEEKLS